MRFNGDNQRVDKSEQELDGVAQPAFSVFACEDFPAGLACARKRSKQHMEQPSRQPTKSYSSCKLPA